MIEDFSSTQSLCDAINRIAPYTVGWALDSPLDVQTLRGFCYADRRERAYREFSIPKKSGGVRLISAPTGMLKDILTCLSRLLSSVYAPNANAMGFVPGRSVKTNAEAHLNRNYVLNIDLSDFFPSIGAETVEKSLTGLGVDGLVAQLVSTLCCYPKDTGAGKENVLPQGAPTSPVLSNIVCAKMDARLQGLADRFHLTYTRYADDITFSSNHNVYGEEGEFFRELRRIISDNGFRINEAKTRLLKRGMRQEVTGLTVGEKVNVSRKWLKNLRAAIFQIERSRPKFKDIQQVTGRLNYLAMIKGEDDPTYRKLRHRLQRIVFFYRRRLKSGEFIDDTLPAKPVPLPVREPAVPEVDESQEDEYADLPLISDEELEEMVTQEEIDEIIREFFEDDEDWEDWNDDEDIEDWDEDFQDDDEEEVLEGMDPDEEPGTPDDCKPDTDDPETLASKDYHSEWRNMAEEIFRQINDSGK